MNPNPTLAASEGSAPTKDPVVAHAVTSITLKQLADPLTHANAMVATTPDAPLPAGEDHSNSDHDHDSHHLTLSQAWAEQGAILQTIESAGGFQSALNSLAASQDGRKNLLSADTCCSCVDEGVADGTGMAGSGLGYVITQGFNKGLEGMAAIEAGIEAASEVLLLDPKITTISSHTGCGAADAVFKKLSEDVQASYGNSVDTFAQRFSVAVAEKVTAKRAIREEPALTYSEHIEALDRPHFHVARVAYLDLTGGHLSPNKKELQTSLPRGFVVRGDLDPAQAVFEMDLVTGIATGSHGFLYKIGTAPNTQFVWVVVIDEQNQAQKGIYEGMKSELEAASAAFGGKVMIEVCPLAAETA